MRGFGAADRRDEIRVAGGAGMGFTVVGGCLCALRRSCACIKFEPVQSRGSFMRTLGSPRLRLSSSQPCPHSRRKHIPFGRPASTEQLLCPSPAPISADRNTSNMEEDDLRLRGRRARGRSGEARCRERPIDGASPTPPRKSDYHRRSHHRGRRKHRALPQHRSAGHGLSGGADEIAVLVAHTGAAAPETKIVSGARQATPAIGFE